MSAGDDSNDRVKAFTEFRQRMNKRILDEPNQVVRRFFALDTQTYQAGALDVKTKELLGLVASMVLRSFRPKDRSRICAVISWRPKRRRDGQRSRSSRPSCVSRRKR